MAVLLVGGGLFLHIPKTGGNWVSDVLEAQQLVFAHVGGKHAGLNQLAPLRRLLATPRRYDRPNRELVPFCFVRHPLAWYQSWFRMNVALGWPHWDSDDDVWNPSVALNGITAPSFAAFLERVVTERPGFLTALYEAYTRDAHFIGRQERAADDLVTVLQLLSLPVDPAGVRRHPQTNVGSAVTVDVSADLRRTLETVERGAYAQYGYAGDGLDVMPQRLGSVTPVVQPFVHDAGHGWRAHVGALADVADTIDTPHRSPLVLLENGQPLPARHAAHACIRGAGQGRYSHWGEMLLFSSSDNSNPNDNGRTYALKWGASAGRSNLMAESGDTPRGTWA